MFVGLARRKRILWFLYHHFYGFLGKLSFRRWMDQKVNYSVAIQTAQKRNYQVCRIHGYQNHHIYGWNWIGPSYRCSLPTYLLLCKHKHKHGFCYVGLWLKITPFVLRSFTVSSLLRNCLCPYSIECAWITSETGILTPWWPISMPARWSSHIFRRVSLLGKCPHVC